MANPEHLKILKQGVKAWNHWRGEHALEIPRLGGADLTGEILIQADLTRADLRAASLGGAFLGGADLSRADLHNSDFSDARVGATVFGDNDLSTVKGLETVRHLGPSTIGIDTIYRSKGDIPDEFLRGAGVPDDFIAYIKSLVGKPVEFYSCFISYSSKDGTFAQRLHSDLQEKGVRCWFAPEDLKMGDKFRMRIDESIRIYDKLMVILSENSIRSSWVEEEVEAAFEKERKQNKLALFPIRLDDAVMETDQPWAASLRRTRHIGDFHSWKEHEPISEVVRAATMRPQSVDLLARCRLHAGQNMVHGASQTTLSNGR